MTDEEEDCCDDAASAAWDAEWNVVADWEDIDADWAVVEIGLKLVVGLIGVVFFDSGDELIEPTCLKELFEHNGEYSSFNLKVK